MKWVGAFVDWVVVPALIIWFAVEPNWPHGFVDYLEAGQYLGPINGIFHGGIPYRDSYTLFGPFFLYLPACVMLLCGKTLAVLRTYFHVAAILNVLIAYGVGCLLCRRRFFRWFIPFVVLLEAYHPFWSTRWGGLRTGCELLLLGCLTRYVQTGSTRALVTAGLVTAFGLLYSTDVGIVNLIVTGALVAWMILGQSPLARERLRDFRWFGVGLALMLFPWGVYVAMHGAFWPYLVTAFWIMPIGHGTVWRRGASLVVRGPQGPGVLPFLASELFKLYVPLLLCGLFFGLIVVERLKRQRTKDATIVWCFTVCGMLLYVMAFRAIDSAQFQMALPPLIIMGGWALEQAAAYVAGWVLSSRHGPARRTPLTLVISGVFLLVVAMYVVGSEKRYFRSLSGWVWYQQHKAALTPFYLGPIWVAQADWQPLRCTRGGGIRVPAFQAQELDGVTQFLQEHTAPEEAIVTFPEHGIFNFLADRPGISRFDIAGFAITTPAWRQEFLAALETHPPRFAIVGKRLSSMAQFLGKKTEVLPEAAAYLTAHYHVIKSFATVDIMERF